MFAFQYQTNEGAGIVIARDETEARTKLAAAGFAGDTVLSLTQVCEATFPALRKAGIWHLLPVDAKEAVIDQFAEVLVEFQQLVNDRLLKAETMTKVVEKSAKVLISQAHFLTDLGGVTPPAIVREERISPRPAARTRQTDPNDCFDKVFKGIFR
jgi:autonomous glycyl radical cofactor GrcA